CLQLDDWGRLDQAVAQAQCELVLIGRADLQAVLEKWLEQPGVWLAYCGRKWSLANRSPAANAVKIGERGTSSPLPRRAPGGFPRGRFMWGGGARPGGGQLSRAPPGGPCPGSLGNGVIAQYPRVKQKQTAQLQPPPSH